MAGPGTALQSPVPSVPRVLLSQFAFSVFHCQLKQPQAGDAQTELLGYRAFLKAPPASAGILVVMFHPPDLLRVEAPAKTLNCMGSECALLGLTWPLGHSLSSISQWAGFNIHPNIPPACFFPRKVWSFF